MAAVLRSLPFCAFEAMGTLRHNTHNTHTAEHSNHKKRLSLRSTRALFAPVSECSCTVERTGNIWVNHAGSLRKEVLCAGPAGEDLMSHSGGMPRNTTQEGVRSAQGQAEDFSGHRAVSFEPTSIATSRTAEHRGFVVTRRNHHHFQHARWCKK